MLRAALRTSRRPLARAASGRWTPRAPPPAPASKRLDAIGRAIFGTLEGNNERSGNKVLRKKLKGPLLADYYFDQSGQRVDEVGREIVKGRMNDVEARRKSQLEVLRRRGKGPPKKGSGKRRKRCGTCIYKFTGERETWGREEEGESVSRGVCTPSREEKRGLGAFARRRDEDQSAAA